MKFGNMGQLKKWSGSNMNFEGYIVLHNGKRWTSTIFSKIGAAKGSITQAINYDKWRNYKREDFEIVRLVVENEIKHYVLIETNLTTTNSEILGIYSSKEKAENQFKYFSKFIRTPGNIYSIDVWKDGEKINEQ